MLWAPTMTNVQNTLNYPADINMLLTSIGVVLWNVGMMTSGESCRSGIPSSTSTEEEDTRCRTSAPNRVDDSLPRDWIRPGETACSIHMILVWRPFSTTIQISRYQNVSILDFIGVKVNVWPGGWEVRMLDLRSTGREFESWPLRYRVQPWASC